MLGKKAKLKWAILAIGNLGGECLIGFSERELIESKFYKK
jgi:hypothetical protein